VAEAAGKFRGQLLLSFYARFCNQGRPKAENYLLEKGLDNAEFPVWFSPENAYYQE
jgi:hypothetical protein